MNPFYQPEYVWVTSGIQISRENNYINQVRFSLKNRLWLPDYFATIGTNLASTISNDQTETYTQYLQIPSAFSCIFRNITEEETITIIDKMERLQRLPHARGGTAQRKIFHLANWSQLIHPGPSSSRSRFFMESSQSCAATLTHYSESYAPASPKDASCHLHCSTITSLICQGQLHRSRGFVTLDDITVWAYGPKIPQMESMLNSYLRDVSIYMKENSLLISARKSPVTLFTPDKHQFQTHPDITLEDTHLPLERSPKILGVIMDPSLSFHKH